MLYPHSFLWHYLWIAPHALQLIIAFFMIRRGLWRQFPIFFSYTLFQVAEQASLFVMDHTAKVTGDQYWYAYMTGAFIDFGFRFGIIREVLASIFHDYPGFEQLTRIVFRWAAVILLFVAVAAVARAPEVSIFPILSRVHNLEFFMDLIQGGLWLAMLLLSFYFGLSWRSFPYGIAFGFGIFSTVEAASEAMRIWTGFVAGYVFDSVNMAAYHCCVIIWLAYLLAPERSRRTAKELPQNNLDQWNAELQRLLLR